MPPIDLSTAYAEILVLVGTETGTAAEVAATVAAALRGWGFEVDVVDMAEAEPAVLDAYSQLVVCTSTHGDGALPEASQPFRAALTAEAPDLSYVAYGIIALGDRAYEPHFIEAAHTWDRSLADLGAVDVCSMHVIDGVVLESDHEAVRSWALGCATAFAAAFADEA